MENIQQMSMLEIAIKLMNEKRSKQPISKLIKEVLEIKGVTDENGDYAAQLYIDITTSSKFVYMGNDEWDLKSRQSLDEWDKDGSAFNNGVVEEEEEAEVEAIPVDDYYSVDDDDTQAVDDVDDEDEASYEEDEYDSVDDDYDVQDDEYDIDSLDDDDDDLKYIDEDDYNEIMDDYEDMYDDK